MLAGLVKVLGPVHCVLRYAPIFNEPVKCAVFTFIFTVSLYMSTKCRKSVLLIQNHKQKKKRRVETLLVTEKSAKNRCFSNNAIIKVLSAFPQKYFIYSYQTYKQYVKNEQSHYSVIWWSFLTEGNKPQRLYYTITSNLLYYCIMPKICNECAYFHLQNCFFWGFFLAMDHVFLYIYLFAYLYINDSGY